MPIHASLIITGSMRACTAVVTEMSWNSSEDKNAKYRAEIEFIKSEDWQKELSILFDELIDGNGNVRLTTILAGEF